jgi:DhnA family fructose-bisphosphate aldolase class Ia
MRRIFRNDGRTLIVAMDHGLIDGPCPGLERPAETIAKVTAGGADAVLTSYGAAQSFASALNTLAQKVAEAAKEGGFLGIGAKTISNEEQQALNEIRAALA